MTAGMTPLEQFFRRQWQIAHADDIVEKLDRAIANYDDDPSAMNARKLTDLFEQLLKFTRKVAHEYGLDTET